MIDVKSECEQCGNIKIGTVPDRYLDQYKYVEGICLKCGAEIKYFDRKTGVSRG